MFIFGLRRNLDVSRTLPKSPYYAASLGRAPASGVSPSAAASAD